MSKLLRVEVSKKRWYRGECERSMLRLANGKQCCIGFLARKLGAKVKDIYGVSTLEDMSGDVLSCFDFRYKFDDQLDEAYVTNDAEEISDIERMKRLKIIGKKMGVQFIFKP